MIVRGKKLAHVVERTCAEIFFRADRKPVVGMIGSKQRRGERDAG